jgi:ubiquinone/menaquinone biosynthesis C-methylase UbiE/alkylhydroperoxidase/carboxymuconolactone decarboxylase family protein YurZ
VRGTLECADEHRWPVRDGIAHLVDERSVRGSDGMLRPIYDLIAPLHDTAADLVLPLLQYPEASTPDIRRRCVESLELGGRGPHRVLEIGVGSGANVPFVDRALGDASSEIWGVDLSEGMLRECRRRVAASPPRHRVRLALCDGHTLPFRDATFDRVLHVGGINGFRDRRRALREVARVTRPGGIVMVVDEGLSREARQSPVHRALFRALTLLDASPRPPHDELPSEATDVESRPVSRFYYGLRFRIGGHATPAAITGKAAPVAAPNDIEHILSTKQIDEFQVAYRRLSQEQMGDILATFFRTIYPGSEEYLIALNKVFFGDLPADDVVSSRRRKLSAADRERCLIAVLASRGSKLNLAVHVYLALMEEVTPGEVGHIMFLAGTYSGIPMFAESLRVAIAVLKLMGGMYDNGDELAPANVLKTLSATIQD